MADHMDKLSYDEVRAVAHEIFKIERKMRTIRTIAMVVAFGILAAVAFCVCMFFIMTNAEKTAVRKADHQLALVSKSDTDTVLKTAESLIDVDGADLIDYKNDKTDASGDPDGDWIVSDKQLAMIRTISWKEGTDMHVHHIAEVQRQDGNDAHVVATTKAKHQIKIHDKDRREAQADEELFNFNVFFRQWDLDAEGGPQFMEWVEVLPEADEDDKEGRGRILVGMKREQIQALDESRKINLEDYWCDVGDECAASE